MGFLSSIGKMFGSGTSERRERAPIGGAPTPGGGVGVIDQATPLREQIHAEQPRPSRRERVSETPVVVEPDMGVPEPTPSAPKNKQELFEELQKNYRDVVDLVKKVDAHLDRNEVRAEEMVSIARRIDETLPALSAFPEEIRSQLDELRREVVGAITTSSQRSDARADEANQALGAISERIDATGRAHTQLVSTMAGFRETLGELATSSARTSDVLQSIDTRRQQREDELTRMLVASRRWSVVTLSVTLVGVSAAVAVAIIALVVNS